MLNGWQRHVHDGLIEDDHERAGADQPQRQPAAALVEKRHVHAASRCKAMTGIVRVVLAWYSAKPGYSSACRAYSWSRSPPVITAPSASYCSVPTSTVTRGCATRLWYQSGFVGAPPFEA